MTLGMLLTLTEMNNGLSAPSQVRDLLAVMEKEKNCTSKNAADSTRHLSAIASAIVATENKDCLDLFLQLDGLDFIAKWLEDALKFDDEEICNIVEESIIHLLLALKKFGVDHENLLSSGIWATVQNLLVHNNPKVQDKAGALFESWKQKNSTPSIPDVAEVGAMTVDKPEKIADLERGMEHPESPPRDGPIGQENSVVSKGHESENPDLSASSNSSKLVESAKNSDKISNLPSGDDGSLNRVNPSTLQNSRMEYPPCSPAKTTSELCAAAVPRQETLNIHRELHDTESSNDTKQPMKIDSLQDKAGLLETSKGRSLASSSLVVKELKTGCESSEKNSTAVEKRSCDEDSSYIVSTEIGSHGNSVKHEEYGLNQCKFSEAFIAGGTSNHYMLPRPLNSEKRWGSPKDIGAFLSGTDDKGKATTPALHVSENNGANITFGKKSNDRGPDRATKKFDVEIDYGIVDPLEVAWQVAMEVEREVVENREPSCNSFEKSLEFNVRQPNSPESFSQRQSHSCDGSPKEVVNDPNSSNESSPVQEESATSSKHRDAEQTNVTQDMVTSQPTEAALGDSDEKKALSKFDLNQEICSEDPDLYKNQFFAPVSFVSASRAAAVPVLPGAPLQFEGNLGWKGSAVTSAFRPASPLRLQESNKGHPIEGSSSSSKQRQGCLDIDLNVAESIDRRLGDMSAAEHIQLYPTVPSGESSAETSSRRSEHLALDLNHSNEDVGTLLDWRIGQFLPQGHRTHGQPLSLMSSEQPARNIDLNGQPAFAKDPSVTTSLRVSQTLNIFGGIEPDDSAISIMGKRVEVNRKELGPQTPQLANGRTPEPSCDINLGRTGNLLGIGPVPSFTHSPGYDYTNISPTPPVSFPSTIFGSGGPITYMMDSSGQPVFPQIMGSASALPTTYTQPPFVVNLNTSASSNGVGTSSRSGFDLNSGMLLESRSKDPSGFGLFLNSAQVRSVDEQMRPNSQPTSMNSVFCGKRKEAENGWEHDPFRHYTPPWKQS